MVYQQELGSDNASGHGHRRHRGGIPTAPSGPPPVHANPPGGHASSGGSSGSSGSTGGSGGSSSARSSGGGGGDSYAAQKRKAGNRYVQQAHHLQGQAAALQHALNHDFKHALHQQLRDIGQTLAIQQRVLRQGYHERVGQLEKSARDNEKAMGTQTSLNEHNMTRERTAALAEVVANGAGESDQMQAQMMSLNNWQANQAEVSRGYFDTLRSVNSSLSDLRIDTKTGFINNVIQANADKEQLWTNYYDQRSEALTNLGNTYGQMADYLSMAHEMGVGGNGSKYAKKARHAWMQAAHAMGQSWNNPGVSKKLRKWDGRADFQALEAPGSHLSSANTVSLDARPEGATLRKW